MNVFGILKLYVGYYHFSFSQLGGRFETALLLFRETRVPSDCRPF